MPPEEFRRMAHRVADWAADYLRDIDTYPVLAPVSPGEVRRAAGSSAPEIGEPMERILDDVDRVIMPGVTHWNHPAFHAYFAVTGSGPGILGETIAATLNLNAMVWRSSPAGTELEEVVMDWLRQLVGLPRPFDGVINDTASTSTLYALAAAREAAYPDARRRGLFGQTPGRIYASEHAHSSVEKAVMTLGFGRDAFRAVPTDDAYRMRPDALAGLMEADAREGLRAVAVVATAGTTSTAALDPVAAVADVAGEHGAWLHVDAAYGGPAAALPEVREAFAGWDRADSVVINPHKWLFTPIDCSALYCRRPEVLRRAFSLVPAYLASPEQGAARSLMDYGVALGRRFRALKLWFVLRYFGREGVRARIRRHIDLAEAFAGWVEAEPDWELAAPPSLGLVVFRFAPAGREPEDLDRLNQAVIEGANATGRMFVGPTTLDGRVVIRFAVGNLRTGAEHVERAWGILRQAASEAVEAGAVESRQP